VKRSLAWLIFLLLLLAGAGSLWEWREVREHRSDSAILHAAQRYGVEPALVKAVVWRESRFDPQAVGGAGEVGLMQVTEIAGMEWAETAGVTDFETNSLFDPFTNTLAGTFYLGRALRRYPNTDLPMVYALAEYNAGRSRVVRWMKDAAATNSSAFLTQMDFPSTRAYVQTILEKREAYLPAFPARPRDFRIVGDGEMVIGPLGVHGRRQDDFPILPAGLP